MRIALGQIDSTLGEVAANLDTVARTVDDAAGQGAELVCLPELALHGYALARIGADRSIRQNDPGLIALCRPGVDVLVGFHEDGGLRRYNSAAYLSTSTPPHVHRKLYLPTYLSWDERKVASPGQRLAAFDTGHGRLATLICADAWQLVLPWLAVQDGAELLLIPANSAEGPDRRRCDVTDYWDGLLPTLARMLQCWVVFVNRVGEEAGYRFWGGSRIVDPDGTVVAQAALWQPDLVLADVDVSSARRRRRELPLLGEARLGLLSRELDRLVVEGGDV